jgi:hypothetical protein
VRLNLFPAELVPQWNTIDKVNNNNSMKTSEERRQKCMMPQHLPEDGG